MSNSSKPIARFLRKFFSWLVIVAFWLNTVLPGYAQTAAGFSLPAVGEQVALSQNFMPLLLKAVKVHPDNPFQFDFIVDEGSSKLSSDELKRESQKLIRYFLASLTTPENDLWVNLSPYEKNRIIPQSFGTTEMGRDLLGEDYLLKQITATLLYPEGELGKKFWDSTGAGSIVPMQILNKVWIVPDKAVVYENGATAYVDETYLKVMLEEDLTPPSLDKEGEGGVLSPNISLQIFRSIILPSLEKEVNEGKNFAPLRQIYNSLILANWYKKRLKDSILSQVYVDKNKVAGIDLDDKEQAQKIYAQYVEAFKKGVYNYIKEDYDPATQETIPRKYFSGGMGFVGSSAATQYRQGLPKKVGVASSSLRRIIVDIESYSNGDLEDQRVRARFAEIQAQNNNKARAVERKKRAHEILSFSGLTGIDFASYYETSQSLAHTPAFGGIITIQPLLIKFIDDVFEKALDLGDPQSMQIVFLQAGAQPIYDAAVLMAKVAGNFPVENLKSVWATMGNYRAMKENNDQKLLFIKYLYDQGVLRPQTKHLLIVDTDAGIVEMGTAAIFAKTLLDNEVVQAANERFGLNIRPFNEGGSENTLEFSYLYSAYVSGSMKRAAHIRTEKISEQIDAKLRIEGYNENTLDIDQAIRISNLWYPVDSFIKTVNISDSFSLDDSGRAVVTFQPPNKQSYDNLKILNLVRAVEDIGLLMGVLNFINTKGYDVRQEADQLIANLENVFKTSGVTQADIDASKPQPGYRASSSLIPVLSAENIGVVSSRLDKIAVSPDFSRKQSSAEMLLSSQDLARSQVIEVLYTNEDIITKYRRMTLRIRVPDGNTRILKLYSDKNNFDNESFGYAVAQKLGMHVPKHQEFENSSDFEGLVDKAVKIGNLQQEFQGSYGWARLIEQVQEYRTNKPYNGLEELVVFTHLMRFDDFENLRAQYGFSKNIYVTHDGKFVAYDYETAWESNDPAIYFFSYKNVADRIDRSKLENAIQKARQLTVDDFSKLLTDQQSREAFQRRVRDFENDMIRELSYWTNEPQAVRLLEIVKNMKSSSAVGGIDLTAGKTPLDIRSQGEPVEFNFDPKELQNLQLDGLVPVIINIVPVVNLPLFLTEKPVSKLPPQLSRIN